MISLLYKQWWKWLTLILITYTIVLGFMIEVPRLHTLSETIRNLFFHVPMWFSMIIVLLISFIYGIKYLRSGERRFDTLSVEMANMGLVLGFLGFATGTLWGVYTWGAGDWSKVGLILKDPKVLGAMLGILIYLAYLVLRGSMDDWVNRARISAIYNVFGFVMFFVFIFIMPRLTASIHPGSGGNPGFNVYDLDSRMRLVFYPAVIGWALLSIWIASLRFRIRMIKHSNFTK